jgi:hypothetical protein
VDPSSAPAARSYRRDGKGGRKRSNRGKGSNSNNSSNRQKGGFQNQTLKVTFRDIQGCASVREIMDMIREVLQKASTTLATKILMDEASVEKLIRTEELVKEAEAKPTKDDAAVPDVDEAVEDTGDKGQEEKAATIVDLKENMIEPPERNMAEIVKGAEAPPVDFTNSISARALYAILPRVSKRRGFKSGCAYLLLHAPTPKASEGPLEAAEKAKLTAIGRLQLALALESIAKLANAEASLSSKSWKDKESHRDRREGTIETTGDYKKFMEGQAAHALAVQSRPKPAPGGGVLSSSSSVEQESQLAAIVLHLRAIRAEQKSRQNAKKKVKKDTAPTPATTTGRGKTDNGKSSKGGNTAANKSGQQNNKSSRSKPKQTQKPKKKPGTQAPMLLKSP